MLLKKIFLIVFCLNTMFVLENAKASGACNKSGEMFSTGGNGNNCEGQSPTTTLKLGRCQTLEYGFGVQKVLSCYLPKDEEDCISAIQKDEELLKNLKIQSQTPEYWCMENLNTYKDLMTKCSKIPGPKNDDWCKNNLTNLRTKSNYENCLLKNESLKILQPMLLKARCIGGDEIEANLFDYLRYYRSTVNELIYDKKNQLKNMDKTLEDSAESTLRALDGLKKLAQEFPDLKFSFEKLIHELRETFPEIKKKIKTYTETSQNDSSHPTTLGDVEPQNSVESTQQ